MRYRVEVDETLTYQVIVDAETVEDAMGKATTTVGRLSSNAPAISRRVAVLDAVELEQPKYMP